MACEDTESDLLLGIFHNPIFCEVQQVSYGFVFSLDTPEVLKKLLGTLMNKHLHLIHWIIMAFDLEKFS